MGIDIKGALLLVLAIAVALFAWRVQSKLGKLDALESENVALRRDLGTLQRQQEAYDKALLEKARQEQYARDVRHNINHQLSEAAKNAEDSGTRAFLGPIPDGVRDAYRAGAGTPAADGAAR